MDFMVSYRTSGGKLTIASIVVAVVTLFAATFAIAAPLATPSTPRPVMVPANFNRLSGPQAVVRAPSELLDSNPSAVRMRFYDPPVNYGTVDLNGQTYQTAEMLGEANTLEPGEPDVPRIARLLMVDRTGNVELRVLNQQYHLEQGGIPAPAQLLAGDDAAHPDGYVAASSAVYANNDWYPTQIATISEPMTLRDVRFVVLNVYPVQVNPVTGERRVYDDLEVIVEDIGGTGPNEITIHPQSISPSFKKIYSMFENFENSAIDALPVYPGTMLIFCGADASTISAVGELAQWKKRKGIDVSVRSGTWSATSIKNTIDTVYSNNGGLLEYVCLVGDPSDTAGTPGYLDTGPSGQYDNYFGTLSSGGPHSDPVPDIAVGRLSNISAVSNLVGLVRKTVRYESNPQLTPDAGWFERAWCASGTAQVFSNPSTKRYTQAIMQQHGVDTVYWDVYPNHFNTSRMTQVLGYGVSVFNYRMSWINEFYQSDITSTTVPADGRNPFVMVITCGTGNFDYEESLSERWLVPPAQTASNPAGAIGAIGVATSSTHVPFNNVIDAGTMYGLYALNLEEQGPVLVAAKLQLFLNYWGVGGGGHNADVQNFSYWSNLMGDPSVPIWIKQPRAATVTKPATVAIGTNNVGISLVDAALLTPVANALVCFEKGTWSSPESWARGYTDAAGAINLPVTLSATGYLYVTITKDDLLTVRDSIQVTAAGGLVYNSRTIDDDNLGGTSGNGNTTLNPGETIDLTIGIRNAGGTSISGVNGTLTTTSSGISITQAVSSYGTIAAGATGNNATAFRFNTRGVFNNEPVTFFLNLTTGGAGSFTIRLDLTPATPDISYYTAMYYGPGYNLDPGETGPFTVTFRNTGAATQSLLSAMGILRSLDPNVIVNDSLGTYGLVSPNALATNGSDRYDITLSSQSFNGHVAPLQLVVYDATGFRDSTNFSIIIGTQATTSPTGPDAYGYYAFDNTETQPAGAACTYSWIEICPYPGFNGLGTSFNWDDQAENGDDYAILTLPFAVKMYGHTFSPSQLTVCDNGWVAFGADSMWDARHFRMGTPIGPPYMVAAYWSDLRVISGSATNVFRYYDAVNHWYIVEWRATNQYPVGGPFVSENFEVIIYDPAYFPSVTGDCKVKVQYQTVNLVPNQNPGPYNDNEYASVGIENADHSTGIDYYYWGAYGPGAAPLQDALAVMYTTDASGQTIPSVTVNTPNGGETWYVGQTYNVLWNSVAVFGNIDVLLNRSYPGGAWQSLYSGTANDGVQAWTAVGPVSSTARIKVVTQAPLTAADTSNANFTIAAPTAQVTYPNGGELLQIGQSYELTFVSTGLGAATVAVNRNYPGGAWEVLDPASGGLTVWTVTGPSSSNARVRVIGNAAPAYGDTSNASFAIGQPPSLAHIQHADGAPGTQTFIATATDDAGGFTTKLFYRSVGAGLYDSVTFAATANPNEYSAVTSSLATGYYEYYLRCTDAQNLSVYVPTTGTYTFDLGALSATMISYDDGVAENYNWVDGPGYKWAVKFDAPSYPYALCNAKFAVCPSQPQTGHQAVKLTVYSADGPGGLPGTVLFSDTSGAPGNIAGGLPTGAAWADVITRLSGNCMTINSAFYIAVENVEPRLMPSAFGTDTSATRANRSYFWDECDLQWYVESSGDANARPGDRMIRAAGWSVSPPTITVIRNGNNAQLNWPSTGAPYYKVYAATTPTGAYTYVGTASTNSYPDPTPWTTNANRFYQVTSSDTP
jgi:hypothetical protein